MEELLSVEGVCKSFGPDRVVDEVTFAVNRGEILGFLGPNGAGKTTTIRMIMGINAPDQGRITFGDGKKGVIPKSRIGYLPEERGLYKEARVMDILLFLAGLKGIPGPEAKTKAMGWLERFDLGDYATAKVEELSKGMAQKVQFTACVLHEPDYLVLDEPFSGLDPVSQDLFKEEIRAMAEGGTAVMLSSHRMNLVEELCDRIFLIHRGREVVYGPLGKIKSEYGNYRVRLRTPDRDRLEGFVTGYDDVEGWEWDGAMAFILLSDGVRPMDFLTAMPADLDVEEIAAERISLHDIFVRVARGGEDLENAMEGDGVGGHAQPA